MKNHVDFLLNVSASRETARIQETHILVGHMICELVDRILFPESD
jgi:D-sedoheptulose 7-phosphate isomerase